MDEKVPFEDEDLVMVTGSQGMAVLPRSIKKMPEDLRLVLDQIHSLEITAAAARDSQDDLAIIARKMGAPWSAIAWAMSMTESGVKSRYLYDPRLGS